MDWGEHDVWKSNFDVTRTIKTLDLCDYDEQQVVSLYGCLSSIYFWNDKHAAPPFRKGKRLLIVYSTGVA